MLLGVSNAVTLNQQRRHRLAQDDHMPTADEIIAECDKSGDGELSKKEVMGCIKKHAPSEAEGKEAADMVNKHWKDVAGKNDKVDKAELKAVMSEHPELAQRRHRLAQEDPSAADVIAFCDGNGDGKLTKKEAIKCIDDHAPEGDKKKAKDEVNKHWKECAGKDGKVDEAEMAEAMKADMESLAQLSKGKKGGKKGGDKADKGDMPDKEDMPSPEEIMAACDADGSGGISKQEAHDCIDEHVDDEDMNAMAHKMIDDEFARVDADGDGEVDLEEGEAEAKKHQKGGKDKDGSAPAK